MATINPMSNQATVGTTAGVAPSYGATTAGAAPIAGQGGIGAGGVGTRATAGAPVGGRGPASGAAVGGTSNFLLYILALLLPPVAVFLKTGLRADFWINVLLTILGWIPGILHAWWVIATTRTVVVY
ncbi:hypothetical protein C8Q72DRAFT_883813 [Fomitopsis betulina]|nr:hypothetical protein C8Q72DRAFT_883813 [Fomitopsis betulina]